MDELMKEIFFAVLTIGTAFLTRYITSLTTKVKEETDSEIAAKYIDRISAAVTTSVTCINQTYVDSLKKSGEFNAEAQKEALRMAVDATVKQLAPEIISWITESTTDVTGFLTLLIEAKVKEAKTA